MPNNIIGYLRNLVEAVSPEEFIAASKRPDVSPYLRRALEAMALERVSYSVRSRRLTRNSRWHNTKPYRNAGAVGNESEQRRSEGNELEQICEIVVNSRALNSKESMIEFARRLGLKLEISKKESRIRAGRKLAKVILSAPADLKKAAMDGLLRSPDKQTEGWFDIIRNP